MFDILLRYQEGFLSGTWVTLQLFLIVGLIGIVAGSGLGWAAHQLPRLAGTAVTVFGFTIASIPVIVFLFWAHYPLQAILGAVIDPFFTSAWVLSLVNTVLVSEIVRNALTNFPDQYLAAAKVCGLSRKQAWWEIRFPLVIHQILPALLSSQIVMLQSTLFAGLISVEELLRVSQRINATAYKPVEIFSIVALFFLLICTPLNGLAVYLKRRYQRDLSEY